MVYFLGSLLICSFVFFLGYIKGRKSGMKWMGVYLLMNPKIYKECLEDVIDDFENHEKSTKGES